MDALRKWWPLAGIGLAGVVGVIAALKFNIETVTPEAVCDYRLNEHAAAFQVERLGWRVCLMESAAGVREIKECLN